MAATRPRTRRAGASTGWARGSMGQRMRRRRRSSRTCWCPRASLRTVQGTERPPARRSRPMQIAFEASRAPSALLCRAPPESPDAAFAAVTSAIAAGITGDARSAAWSSSRGHHPLPANARAPHGGDVLRGEEAHPGGSREGRAFVDRSEADRLVRRARHPPRLHGDRTSHVGQEGARSAGLERPHPTPVHPHSTACARTNLDVAPAAEVDELVTRRP